MEPISCILSSRTSIGNPVQIRRHIDRPLAQIALVLAAAVALAWLVILGVQPVHVPLGDFSKGRIPAFTQALSGVKGQTLTVPSDRLSRIDIWMRTQIPEGEHIQVTFSLIAGIDRKDVLASGIVIFDRARTPWQARVVFDPDHVSRGDRLYLRMESVLSSPEASIHYAFVSGDLYPSGELHDDDLVTFPDQDLRFELYLEPRLPKPFAWLEAVLGPTAAASARANGPPAWIVASLTLIVGALTAASIILSSLYLASHAFPASLRFQGTTALILVMLAVVSSLYAGAEAPVAKLWVHLT